MSKKRRKPRARKAHRRAPSRPPPTASAFLPTTPQALAARGWQELDILLLSGDAYLDHPANGAALLGRFLEAQGYRVGLLAQPDWRRPESVTLLGRPRLCCGISAGCLDSMLAHYTAFRKKRRDDANSPGGRAGLRPNRAVTVYANLVRSAFPGLPLLIGGIEASLRRLAHYDFWTDKLRRSLLLDTRADLLLYGMAETALLDALDRLERGTGLEGIPGTAWTGRNPPADAVFLPTRQAMEEDRHLLLEATLAVEAQVQARSPRLAQAEGKQVVIVEPPPEPLATAELDALYALPFTREPHPAYHEPIPAAAMLRDSLTAVRGCGGGCTFCSLALHQGRRLRSRSAASLEAEAAALARQPAFSGTLTDVGGPTANAWASRCRRDPETCQRRSCYSPTPCPALELEQGAYLKLLQRLRAVPGVKHVRVASGLRHDLALQDAGVAEAFVRDFVGGQLKLAPEHSAPAVLALMGKSDFALFERFRTLFTRASRDAGKEQYIVPYIMSAFPGCTVADMEALAAWFRRQGWQPQQVQCFIPTPGTVATALYYAGCDLDGKAIHVARSDRERLVQHHCLTGEGKGR